MNENPVAIFLSQLSSARHSIVGLRGEDVIALRNLMILFTQSESLEEAEFYMEAMEAIGQTYGTPDIFIDYVHHFKVCNNCSKKEIPSQILATFDRLEILYDRRGEGAS